MIHQIKYLPLVLHLCIRRNIHIRSSGYEYFFEYTNEEQEGDILFDESSFKIYVDSNSFEFLKGSEVDFVSTGLNQGIIFNNPNAKVTCGCGESFSI